MGTTWVPRTTAMNTRPAIAARVSATCRDVSRCCHQELVRLNPYAVAASVPTAAQNVSIGRSRHAGDRAEGGAEHKPPGYQLKSWAERCRELGQAGIGNGLLGNDDDDAQMVPPSVNVHDRTITGIVGVPGSTDRGTPLVGPCT